MNNCTVQLDCLKKPKGCLIIMARDNILPQLTASDNSKHH